MTNSHDKHSTIFYMSLVETFCLERSKLHLWGVYSDGVTPDPISNSEVKPVCGNTSARVILCEGSTMPHYFIFAPQVVRRLLNGLVITHQAVFVFSGKKATLMTAK